MVSPLLCGVGFRLLPALISARSSELSPVGDIMLKDLVPVWKQKRGRWPGVGQGSCTTPFPYPLLSAQCPCQARKDRALPGAQDKSCEARVPRGAFFGVPRGGSLAPGPRQHQPYSRGVWPPPGGPWQSMVALGLAVGTLAYASTPLLTVTGF